MSRASVVMCAAIALGATLLVSGLAGVTGMSSPSLSSPTELPTSAPLGTAPTNASASSSGTTGFGINAKLAGTVAADERALQAGGRNPTALHPPNLHQAPSLAATHGTVIPLYYQAPAPMGVGYFGLSNTTGTVRATTVNTTSLAGTFSTSDPLGTQTEEFDVPTGPSGSDLQPARDSYGAQLNAVLTNVTIFGNTSFYNPNDPDAPTGCPGYAGNPLTGPAPCPNEFWMQNYIEYVPATHTMRIGDEVWNNSNPLGAWGGVGPDPSYDERSVVGCGSIDYGLYPLSK